MVAPSKISEKWEYILTRVSRSYKMATVLAWVHLAFFACVFLLSHLVFFAFLPPLQSLVPGYIRPSQIRQPWDLHILKSLPGGQLPKSISTGGWHFLIAATIMAITARNPVCLVSTDVVLMSCKFQCVRVHLVFPNAGKCNRHTQSWEKRFISFL